VTGHAAAGLQWEEDEWHWEEIGTEDNDGERNTTGKKIQTVGNILEAWLQQQVRILLKYL